MSFRDVAYGREDGTTPPAIRRRPKQMAGMSVFPSRNNRGKPLGKKNNKAGTPSPSSGLLYGRLRLVPSSSCESSSQSHTDDEPSTSLDESISSASASPSTVASQESQSLNPNSPPRKRNSNPQSGSASRGMPGFSTHRRRRSSGNPKAQVEIRGWSQAHAGKDTRQRGEVIHRTGASPKDLSSRRGSKPIANPQQAKNNEFAELSTEIKHFQKMVAQLESLLGDGADSPEHQWKSRILVRSAQEADRDIADKLYWFEKDLVDHGCTKEARMAQAACLKLHRDYRRSHKSLDATLQEQQRQQQADISEFLGPTAAGDPAMLLQQEQEDFFERATREREEEIKNISHKMQQVNDIYQELAALVDGQQEQIDAVEENVHAAKNSVDRGLKHIEYARDRLCVMGDEGYDVARCGGGMDDVEGDEIRLPERRESENHKRFSRSSRGDSDTFNWSSQFQSLQKDIFGLGNDLASLGCTFSDNLECGLGKSAVFDEGDVSSLAG